MIWKAASNGGCEQSEAFDQLEADCLKAELPAGEQAHVLPDGQRAVGTVGRHDEAHVARARRTPGHGERRRGFKLVKGLTPLGREGPTADSGGPELDYTPALRRAVLEECGTPAPGSQGTRGAATRCAG